MSKANILLIEDNRIARKVGILFLTQLECQVTGVNNAAEALELLDNHVYDMIFVDIGLPDMDGLTLVEKIRASDLNGEAYIVILTAHENQAYMDQAKFVGANDFVVKPLSIEKSLELLGCLV